MRRFAFTLFAVATLAASAARAATTTGVINPAPFTATYTVSYRGFEVGRLRFELRTGEANTFVYETRAQPGLAASFIVGDQAVERSVMHIDSDGVRPLSWFLDDGKPGEAKDGGLTFAWDKQQVTGTMGVETIRLPTETGLQDRLSLQVAVLTALQRGREPGTLPMIDRDRIKRYSYRRTGTTQVKTPAGEFETVVYESTRPGSNRLSRVWHASALGYVPVRAEQLRKGKVETVMELLQLERGTR